MYSLGVMQGRVAWGMPASEFVRASFIPADAS